MRVRGVCVFGFRFEGFPGLRLGFRFKGFPGLRIGVYGLLGGGGVGGLGFVSLGFYGWDLELNASAPLQCPVLQLLPYSKVIPARLL